MENKDKYLNDYSNDYIDNNSNDYLDYKDPIENTDGNYVNTAIDELQYDEKDEDDFLKPDSVPSPSLIPIFPKTKMNIYKKKKTGLRKTKVKNPKKNLKKNLKKKSSKKLKKTSKK